jgi:type II secretory pathway pseudopilin PulG
MLLDTASKSIVTTLQKRALRGLLRRCCGVVQRSSKPLKASAVAADSRVVTRLPDSTGFSLVEVMIAALILLIGAGAAFSLIDGANRSVTANAARVGGTNLGRELAEYARTTDYDLLQPGQVVAAMRKHASIAGKLSGGTWTMERRGVTYTIDTSVCTFDDPKDGLAAAPLPNACPKPAPVTGAPNEINPDDFRRVTFAMTWKVRGRSGRYSHSTMVVNPAGGLGPRITQFDEPGAQVTADQISWGATSLLKLKSSPAASVYWTVDDGVSGGDAGGGPTAWGFDWTFGMPFSTTSPWVRDGTYTIQAQARDSRGVPGEGKIITVHINRHRPAAVAGLIGGYNDSRNVVDMRWNRYDERDLQGYRVTRMSDGAVICAATNGLSCTDTNPPVLGSVYKVEALDCVDLKASPCVIRDGDDAFTVAILPIGGTSPHPPTDLTASIVDGKPTLTWTAPANVSDGPIRFYRIYRDTGTSVSERYDETVTSDPTYVDPDPGSTTSHKYWVTAVDQNFNESDPSAPVVSP